MSKYYLIAALTMLTLAGCSGGDSQAGETGGTSGTTGTTGGTADNGGKPLVVGFSQIGAESNWRTANTDSIKGEAAKRGIELKFADAQQKQETRSRPSRASSRRVWMSSPSRPSSKPVGSPS